MGVAVARVIYLMSYENVSYDQSHTYVLHIIQIAKVITRAAQAMRG